MLGVKNVMINKNSKNYLAIKYYVSIQFKNQFSEDNSLNVYLKQIYETVNN